MTITRGTRIKDEIELGRGRHRLSENTTPGVTRSRLHRETDGCEGGPRTSESDHARETRSTVGARSAVPVHPGSEIRSPNRPAGHSRRERRIRDEILRRKRFEPRQTEERRGNASLHRKPAHATPAAGRRIIGP